MTGRIRRRVMQDSAPDRVIGITWRSVLVASAVAVGLAAILVALSVASVRGGGHGVIEYGELADGKSIGASDAPVTILEFGDAECGGCQEYAMTTERQLIATYMKTGNVRLVFRQAVVHGDESLQAALASEAAAAQNKFWEYREILMALRASSSVEGDLDIAVLQNIAEEVGLDMEAFDSALLSAKYQFNIDRDFEEGQDLGLQCVPTLFINGEKIEGYISFKELQERIDALLGED